MELIIDLDDPCTLIVVDQRECFAPYFLKRQQHALLNQINGFASNQVTTQIIFIHHVKCQNESLIDIAKLKFNLLIPNTIFSLILSYHCLLSLPLKFELNVRIHFPNQLCVPCQMNLNAANNKFANYVIVSYYGHIHIDNISQWSLKKPIPILFDQFALDLMLYSWHFDQFIERESKICIGFGLWLCKLNLEIIFLATQGNTYFINRAFLLIHPQLLLGNRDSIIIRLFVTAQVELKSYIGLFQIGFVANRRDLDVNQSIAF